MREYMSEAVVLNREPIGEFDFLVSLFTKRYGKINARARSARKIVSKLSGHLLPGRIADVRLVEQRGIQIVDALSAGALPLKRFDLYFLNTILPEWERDAAVWEALTGANFDWLSMLRLLGWAGENNYCAQCGAGNAAVFYGRTQELFCSPCAASRFARNPEDYVRIRNA